MKKNFVRAVVVASFSLFVAAAGFTATTTMAFAKDAKDAKDADRPTVSKAVSKPLSEAQKAFNAKDWAGMLAKVKSAQEITGTTDYDKYLINYFMGLALYNSGDKVGSTPYFVAAAESTAAPPDERATALRIAIDLSNQGKDYATVKTLGQQAAEIGAMNGGVAAIIAIAYYDSGDYPNAEVYAHKSIDVDTAAGKLPDRSAYQVLLMAQNRQKDIPGETKTLGTMANNYGNADDWGHLIDISLGTLPKSSNRETAALYLYRLRMVTGATSVADDYTMASDLALLLRYPGDAQKALQQGIAAGVLNQASAAAAVKKADAAARTDEPTLTVADAAAAKSPSANGDVSVAGDYYGYGRYADAIRVAQRAVSKSGPKAIEARLLLGVAQARQGDNTAAAQNLAMVRGDAALEKAAQLWLLYATRKYGQPGAAAPAGQ